MLKKYISDYLDGSVFTPETKISQEICGVKVNIQPYIAEPSKKGNLEKADLTFEKNGLKYECVCIDQHHWDNSLFPLKINGKDYLCFRKTLYGFTLLSADTLTEEYDYFPEAAVTGDESFIIADAKSFSDLIIFYGCYWACPYGCYAYDHSQKRFVFISQKCGITDCDEPEIKDGKLLLKGTTKDNVSKTVELAEAEIFALLKSNGETGF